MSIIPEWILDEVRYRWENLALREKINSIDIKKMFIISSVSVFIFLAALIWVIWPEKKQVVQDYKKAWFYDLNTNQLFVAGITEKSLIEAPSGPLPDGTPAGVKAYVYSYVNQPGESDRIIGFLWKHDTNVQQTNITDRWDKGKLVKKPQDKDWVPADSKKGREIVSQAFKTNKDGVYPISCPVK